VSSNQDGVRSMTRSSVAKGELTTKSLFIAKIPPPEATELHEGKKDGVDS